MLASIIARAALVLPFITALSIVPAGSAAQEADAPDSGVANKGVVELETGRASDISVNMAQDIASIIDDGATRRVVPVVGKGAVQTLADLRFLRGIDLAIVQSDALDYAKEQHLLPGLQSSLTYVAKLYNEEFHLLARPDIKTVADLANQTVDIGVQGSGSAITATRLFGLLKINATMATDNEAVALDRLRKGEIAAIGFVAAKPVPFIQLLKPADGLHLLGIPLASPVIAAYAPTRLTASDYPSIVAADRPVDTIAVGSVLMAADLRFMPDRYRSTANAVEAFFTGFQTLLTPGHEAKWQEVNIASELPGWTRFPPAQEWLRQNIQAATLLNPGNLKTLFSEFIDERRQATGRAPMSPDEKDALFHQFQAWQRGQAR